MRNDKTYGSGNEIHIFSTMCGIQIKYFVRTINSSKCLKKKKDEINVQIFNEKGIGNFGVLLDYYKKNEKVNHFSPLIYRKGNGISDEDLIRIKKIICGINPDSKDVINFEDFEIKDVISGKTGKKLGSRQGRSVWNLFTLYSVEKKIVKLCDYYKVVKSNVILNDSNKVDYSNLMNCNKLSNIIHHFNADNFKKKGVEYIISEYKNINIDKINEKNKEINFESKNIKSPLNLNDELCKEFVRCICYYCSGLSKKNKPLYKICRYELKNHCRDRQGRYGKM